MSNTLRHSQPCVKGIIPRFGFERLIREAKAKKRGRDHDAAGRQRTLWELPIPGDEPLVMVEVVNSSPEPDGSFKTYWLRVPPQMQTPYEAVAWTFGVADYAPAVET